MAYPVGQLTTAYRRGQFLSRTAIKMRDKGELVAFSHHAGWDSRRCLGDHLILVENPMTAPSKPRFSPPLAVYLVVVCLAFLIGDTYSCSGGQALYVIVGLLSLPLLMWMPYGYCNMLHWAAKITLATVYPVIGVAVWLWAFDAGGMIFMCRLF
jgi:hypothetical protein